MTSAGNPATMANAKDIVYSAIIGLALALLSWIIVSTINPELLFTTEPGMPSANLPSTSIGGNVPGSCAYGSLSRVEGPEPEENCRCIGDTDVPGDTTCEAKKSDYADWCNGKLNCEDPILGGDIGCDCGTHTTIMADLAGYCCASTNTIYNTGNPVADKAACQAACTVQTDITSCDSICHTAVCNTKPECCLKPDLRVGTNLDDVKYKEITAYVDQPIYFDIMTYSVNCLDTSPTGIIKYEIIDPTEDWSLLVWGDYICLNDDAFTLNWCTFGVLYAGIVSDYRWTGFHLGYYCGGTDPIQHSYSTAKDVEVELKITSRDCVESKSGLDKVKIHVINR